jgi:outer membrane lipoprotein SlyB
MALKYAGLLAALALAGCHSEFSPNTYSAEAVQQANKVEPGVVVGVRAVDVKVAGTTGAVAGGAAGSIAGSQLGGSSATAALGAVGGGLIGGILGSATEQAMDNTKAFEYIVRKPNGDLLSVTQTDTTPLALGQHVLVIDGKQARVVPDYTVLVVDPSVDAKPKPAPKPVVPAAAPVVPEPATPPATPVAPVVAVPPAVVPEAPAVGTSTAPTSLAPTPLAPTPTPTLPPTTPTPIPPAANAPATTPAPAPAPAGTSSPITSTPL